MTSRTRHRFRILGLVTSLVVLAAAAAAMLDTARLVDVLALSGASFAAGASTVSLVRNHRAARP